MKLFVDGLPPSYDVHDVADLFGRFGTVVAADVARNTNGQSLQFGYVAMATSAEAALAMRTLNGSTVGGHLLLVLVAENQWSECRAQPVSRDIRS